MSFPQKRESVLLLLIKAKLIKIKEAIVGL